MTTSTLFWRDRVLPCFTALLLHNALGAYGERSCVRLTHRGVPPTYSAGSSMLLSDRLHDCSRSNASGVKLCAGEGNKGKPNVEDRGYYTDATFSNGGA